MSDLMTNLRRTLLLALKSNTNIELRPKELEFLIKSIDNAEMRMTLLEERINYSMKILQGDEDGAWE